MARTPEMEIPLAKPYIKLLDAEIKAKGRDRIAKLAEVDPSTVHRNVNEGNLKYTTAMKLRDAIEQAHAEDKTSPPRFIPPPFCPVVSQGHWDLCNVLGQLHEIDGEAFGAVFEFALSKLHEAERDRLLERAKQEISHPIRNPTDDEDRGD